MLRLQPGHLKVFNQSMHDFDEKLACVTADSFPFSGGAEIEQAIEKRASEGLRLGWAKKLGPSPHPLPLLLILPLFRSFPPVRERLEKERKRLLRRLTRSIWVCLWFHHLFLSSVKISIWKRQFDWLEITLRPVAEQQSTGENVLHPAGFWIILSRDWKL